MSETAGERRVVTALVADVAGSTGIGERLGPERSKFLFDEVVRLMREEVERFGGTVAQLTGDGILALFGAPTAHEDDSERAVRAAVALHQSIARYAAEIGPAYGIELAVRVAVNTGPVVLPQHDAPPDVLYNALGDTVNVAARLQAFGDLVLGPATARQVEQSFGLQELGELEQ
jgi:class 3 adenylate cyclase